MAFIYPVKPLKHAGLMLRRNANAGIGNGYHSVLPRSLGSNGNAAAGHIVLYGVFAKVVQNLLQQRAHAVYRYRAALHGYGNLLLLCRALQLGNGRFGQCV